MTRQQRTAFIAGSVVLFHIAALWALQTGLLRRAVENVVPANLLSAFIEPPAPAPAQARPQPVPRAVDPVKQPVTRKVEPQLPPPPRPVAIADATPSPDAPAGVVEAPPITAAVASGPAAPVPAPPPAPPRVELPSSNADYLQNPKPPYPPVSKRLGEQGSVVLRVLIGADGAPQRAEIRQSSGFDRLDQSALATVLKWRYVPGKRAGVPETMWFNVPVNFVLE